MADSSVGKEAEEIFRKWLDRPEDGYSFDRVYDQMTGFFGSSNICDFQIYKFPYQYYIECKATWEDRFDFANISKTQHDGLLQKSSIAGVFAGIMLLYASHQRAFLIDIREIDRLEKGGKKSLNIKKIVSSGIKYSEVRTIPNNRRKHLLYDGEIEDYIHLEV